MTSSVVHTGGKSGLGFREIIAAWGIAFTILLALFAGSMTV